MPQLLMNLRILLPFQVFAEKADVVRIVARTSAGSFGILPHRSDCVAALTPGILIYESRDDGETMVAVDEGALIKTGQDVLISVRRATAGRDLDRLKDQVEKEFLALDDQEMKVRSVVAKLEAGLVNRIAAFDHD